MPYRLPYILVCNVRVANTAENTESTQTVPLCGFKLLLADCFDALTYKQHINLKCKHEGGQVYSVLHLLERALN